MSSVTTHILDLSSGRPAAGVEVRLLQGGEREAREIGATVTDRDGRASRLATESLEVGEYRLLFETGSYFEQQGVASFYPRVEVTFRIEDPGEHYHVPLLLSPFGYSTYRGS